MKIRDVFGGHNKPKKSYKLRNLLYIGMRGLLFRDRIYLWGINEYKKDGN